MICPHCWKSINKSDFPHPKSNQESDSKLLCPICGHDLPQNFLSASQHIISTVAGNNAGKSNFLAVHLKELRDRLYYKYGCFLKRSKESDRHLEEMIEQVYGSPIGLPKTKIGGVTTQLINNGHRTTEHPKPLIYTLERPGIKQEHNFVYYHQAGEMYESYQYKEAWEVRHASGIIFLFNPFEDQNFRRQMAKHSDNNCSDPQFRQKHLDTQMTSVLGSIKQEIGNVPIAVVIGKYDAWRGLARAHFSKSNYFTDPRGDKGLDNAIENNSMKLRELLQNITDGVCSQFDSLPGPVTYFPVSSFGISSSLRDFEAFSHMSHPVPVKPFLVDVPMLWLIHKFAPELVSV